MDNNFSVIKHRLTDGSVGAIPMVQVSETEFTIMHDRLPDGTLGAVPVVVVGGGGVDGGDTITGIVSIVSGNDIILRITTLNNPTGFETVLTDALKDIVGDIDTMELVGKQLTITMTTSTSRTVDLNDFALTTEVEALINVFLENYYTKNEVDDLLTGLDFTHFTDYNNPHQTSKAQVGLSEVDNTSDLNKPISIATQSALDNKIETSEIGIPNGVAPIGSNGLVPSTFLPAYVSDIATYPTFADLPVTGLDDVIYITEDTNLTYRWSGVAYVEISPSLALGFTSTTAYRGDLGQALRDDLDLHVPDLNNPHRVTKDQVGLGNVDNTSDLDKPISNATQDAIDELNLHAELRQGFFERLVNTNPNQPIPSSLNADAYVFRDSNNQPIGITIHSSANYRVRLRMNVRPPAGTGQTDILIVFISINNEMHGARYVDFSRNTLLNTVDVSYDEYLEAGDVVTMIAYMNTVSGYNIFNTTAEMVINSLSNYIAGGDTITNFTATDTGTNTLLAIETDQTTHEVTIPKAVVEEKVYVKFWDEFQQNITTTPTNLNSYALPYTVPKTGNYLIMVRIPIVKTTGGFNTPTIITVEGRRNNNFLPDGIRQKAVFNDNSIMTFDFNWDGALTAGQTITLRISANNSQARVQPAMFQPITISIIEVGGNGVFQSNLG